MRRTIERRPVVLASALVMFVAVFAWRELVSDQSDEIALLYVMPIALIALELGLWAGIGASALAVALVGLWLLTTGSGVDGMGVITRGVTFLAIGAIAGHFSDRMQDGQRRYRLLLQSGLTLAHLDAEDDLPRTLAEQARQLVPSESAGVELSDGRVVSSGYRGACAYEESFPVALRGRPYGTLQVSPHRPLAAEDRAALAILGLQAAVAAENRQLLQSERERAVIEAELRDAQVLLAERGGQLRALMARQEAERGQLSSELHDDAAQVLAAVLMGLKALELQLGANSNGHGQGVQASWQTLRGDIDSTLQLLRALAISLRPPVLRLGLEAALEDLADSACAKDGCEVAIDLDPEIKLDPELETTVYRIVEETLLAVGPPRKVRVHHDAEGALVVAAQGSEGGIDGDRLRILTARAELIGGTVTASSTALRVRIRPRAGQTQAGRPAAATG